MMNFAHSISKSLGMTCGVAALVCVALPSHAAVLVSNLDQPRRDESIIQANPTDVVPLPWGAQSFVTDGQAYRLDSIDVVLGQRQGDPTLVFELHADADGQTPGALITTLVTGAPLAAGAPVATTLTPTTTTNLAAGTAYWLVAGAFGDGSYAWEYAEGNAQTGVGALGNYAYSSDQGGSWTGFGGDNPFKIAVNVSAVPLPGMAMAFGMSALGLLVRRRRATTRAD